MEREAHRWRDAWLQNWPAGTLHKIAPLYAELAMYRSVPFRDPVVGREEIERHLRSYDEAESDLECKWGAPIVDGTRAAIEWWASWTEEGEQLTMTGTTILRFDAAGLILDHRDYWNQTSGTVPPYLGWLNGHS